MRTVGTDPDYRFTLANERTFLAWLRTGLGLLAGAVALSGLIHDFGPRPMRLGMTALLLALSLGVTVGAYWRWDRAERAMRQKQALSYDPLPRLLVAGISIVILSAAVLVYLAQAR